MAEKKELSHAEIWDDSALINTWDEALQEYKKYHSIQATGGTLESASVMKQSAGEVEMKDVPSPHVTEHNASKEDIGVEEGGVQFNVQEEPASQGTNGEQTKEITIQGLDPRQPEASSTPNVVTGPSTKQTTEAPKLPPFPPSLLASDNEALRNLMISWYFAGYYTGLYEGQQMQQKQQQKDL
ncbi:hypothetical protein BDZ91DRAFT_845212 [Kalaharituber pfeilii]|nr:hypothetical protein BDZ91DRAFT_845212 [Kalaharituber pfeilii]